MLSMISRMYLSAWAGLITLVIVVGMSCASSTEGRIQLSTTPVPMPNTSFGPDYSISNIILPDQASWIDTGTTLTPNITIKNAGSERYRKGCSFIRRRHD